jgi:hypothetical protein
MLGVFPHRDAFVADDVVRLDDNGVKRAKLRMPAERALAL